MWIDILVKILTALFGQWLNIQTHDNAEKQLGANEQTKATESQANVLIKEAQAARAAVKPITVDELPTHNPTNDPDFRD